MINIIEEGFMLAKKIYAHSYLINLELHGLEKELDSAKNNPDQILVKGRSYYQMELEHHGYSFVDAEGSKHLYKDSHGQIHRFNAVFIIGSKTDPFLEYIE
jgi:hypothetical protein